MEAGNAISKLRINLDEQNKTEIIFKSTDVPKVSPFSWLVPDMILGHPPNVHLLFLVTSNGVTN